MFKLVIQDDEGKTTVVPLIRDEITIGRKEGNTIRLTERNVSRRHARILRNNGEVQIEDLGSYNGIRVNNARIAERVALRVSDQVQIGDYKLYLKAEGVEQVDDARTMPIERVGSAGEGTPTDVMTAVAPAPTQPMSIPTTPAGTLPPGAQLVGSPNRTLVAVADTDPQGRPLANPAVVQSLAAPVGYGKMVVLSSNFAGKEFELSRPQMIIGRTDENDIVVNHRSISRNHAKVVREPETGRYTISDLQSSNGVRVNGQDYGKVELRRGDVIDLGHVRLRFVEPGEDFIFSRDAVITDVPESGNRRGLMIAIFISVVVLAGTMFFLLTQNKGDGEPKGQGSGTGGAIVKLPDDAVVATNTPEAVEQVQQPAPPPPAPTQDANAKRAECKQFAFDKKWQDAINCAKQLQTMKDPAATQILADADSESNAEATLRRLNDAAKNDQLKAAKKELDSIPGGSVYKKDAEKVYKDAEVSAVKTFISRAEKAKGRDRTCSAYNNVIDEARKQGVETDVKAAVRCAAVVAGGNDQAHNPPNPPNPPTPPQPPPDKPKCDPAVLKASADQKLQQGLDAAALLDFEAAIKCGAGGDIFTKAFMAACRSRNEPKARQYYTKLPGDKRDSISQICVRNGITF